MTIFNDEHRTVEIGIRAWDETRDQWSPDWSNALDPADPINLAMPEDTANVMGVAL